MFAIKYLYKASNKTGQTVEGIIEAPDKKAVLGALRSKSLFLLDVSELSQKSAIDISLGSAKIPKKVLAVFCTQFASILKAGVPLIQALNIMDAQIENKKLKKIVQTVYEELQRGKGLSEAFAEHEKALPSMMIKMIEAGEISGTLDLSLRRLAQQFEKEVKINKQIKSAMRYPMIVSIVTVLVVVFLLVFVVPRFMGFFSSSSAELPGVTKFLLTISDAITNGWMYIIGGILLIYGLFKMFKGSPKGRLVLDSYKFKMPLIGKSYIRILAARFSRTMSTLTSTGISLTQSLKIASKVVSNKLAENKLLEVEERIREGKTLHASIKEADIFPPMTMHMIKIGEEAGTLDEMLEKAAEYFEDEADAAIAKMTSMIQPILLIIVAVVVVFIMLSILMPIFSMYQNIA